MLWTTSTTTKNHNNKKSFRMMQSVINRKNRDDIMEHNDLSVDS